MTARDARRWLPTVAFILALAGWVSVLLSVAGCTRIVAVPAPAPVRITVPLSRPLPGDTLAAPGAVKVLVGCSVYAWRLARDTTLRLALADCRDAPPPVPPQSGGSGRT